MAAFITANRSKIKIKQNRNESRNEIENLKSQLKSYLANNKSSLKRNIHTTPIDNNKISDIEKKINHLENELSKMAMVSYSAHNITLPQSQTPPVPQQFNTKSAYFGTAISGEKGKGYFKKLLANKEDARFSAQITDKKAMFAPIVPLNAIISSDAMDLAIEFIGVSKNEAVDMSITHEGIAQQVGEKWIIIQKAIIKLKK